MKALFLIGRSLFGAFFLYSGIHHFQELKMLSGYAGSKGVPASKVAVGATGALLIAGGTSILLGVKPKLGALAAVTFLGSVSPVMHDFWNTQDPNQRTQDMINFSKNM